MIGKVFEILNVKFNSTIGRPLTDPKAYYAIKMNMSAPSSSAISFTGSESVPYYQLQHIMHYFGVAGPQDIIGLAFASAEDEFSKGFKDFLGFVTKCRNILPPSRSAIFEAIANEIVQGAVPILYPTFDVQALYAVLGPILADANSKAIESELAPMIANKSWGRVSLKRPGYLSKNQFLVAGAVTMALKFDQFGNFSVAK